jgi:hypothetical protein
LWCCFRLFIHANPLHYVSAENYAPVFCSLHRGFCSQHHLLWIQILSTKFSTNLLLQFLIAGFINGTTIDFIVMFFWRGEWTIRLSIITMCLRLRTYRQGNVSYPVIRETLTGHTLYVVKQILITVIQCYYFVWTRRGDVCDGKRLIAGQPAGSCQNKILALYYVYIITDGKYCRNISRQLGLPFGITRHNLS